MAAQYEIDFKHFDVEVLRKLPTADLVALGEQMNNKRKGTGNTVCYTTESMTDAYKQKGSLTPNQHDYLARLVMTESKQYAQYEQDLFAWFDSRDDIKEIYQYGMRNTYQYIQRPGGSWVYKGGDGWDTSWEERPVDAHMFWRVMGDWNVKKFREVKRESVFEEGDLIVLRKPHVGNWRYDPYYDGSNTPDKLTDRIGTVMQMTEDVHRRSRAGKGSRLVNVLWIGSSDIKGVPERIIKLHERKKRAKK